MKTFLDPNDRANTVENVFGDGTGARLVWQEGQAECWQYAGEPGGFLAEADPEGFIPGYILARYGPGETFGSAAEAEAYFRRETPEVFLPRDASEEDARLAEAERRHNDFESKIGAERDWEHHLARRHLWPAEG